MSVNSSIKNKIVEWLVANSTFFSLILGLLINLGLLLYAFSSWPGNQIIPFLVLIVVYGNLSIVYLQANVKRIRALQEERTRAAQALETERARVAQVLKTALQEERARAAQALETALQEERSCAAQALETERARVTQIMTAETNERAKSLAQRDKKWYQSFSRVLTPEDEQLFCTKWSEILGVSLEPTHIRYLQHRINQVENLCLGRLAGTVQDAILRILVASTIKDRSLRLLEIGTLFGVNPIIMYDILSHFFEQVKLTLLDPLDGYYGSNKIDIVTGIPVTRSVLKRNLDCLNIPAEDYTIIQAYSTAPIAVQQAGRRSYNFIWIDGDHSYNGVKADFELYSPMLEPGGYLVFDDYHREAWPEVGRFVDEAVLNSPLFDCFGTSWNTIVFRKKYDDNRVEQNKGAKIFGCVPDRHPSGDAM